MLANSGNIQKITRAEWVIFQTEIKPSVFVPPQATAAELSRRNTRPGTKLAPLCS